MTPFTLQTKSPFLMVYWRRRHFSVFARDRIYLFELLLSQRDSSIENHHKNNNNNNKPTNPEKQIFFKGSPPQLWYCSDAFLILSLLWNENHNCKIKFDISV